MCVLTFVDSIVNGSLLLGNISNKKTFLHTHGIVYLFAT